MVGWRFMGACALLVLLPLLDGAAAAPAPVRLHKEVELIAATGERVFLKGFHRALRGDLLHGYRGSAEIEIVWDRIRELEIRPGETPGARMGLTALLDDGERVEAEFDEREGEQRFSGVATFGRVSLFFRDIRYLRVVRATTEGAGDAVDQAASRAVRARVLDRQGIATELDRFRRYAGENVLRACRGALSVAVPLAWIERVELAPDPRSPMLALRIALRGVSEEQRLNLPIPEEKVLYGGQASFGAFRVSLGDLRAVEVLEVLEQVTADPGSTGDSTADGEEQAEEAHPRSDSPPKRLPAEEERPITR